MPTYNDTPFYSSLMKKNSKISIGNEVSEVKQTRHICVRRRSERS